MKNYLLRLNTRTRGEKGTTKFQNDGANFLLQVLDLILSTASFNPAPIDTVTTHTCRLWTLRYVEDAGYD